MQVSRFPASAAFQQLADRGLAVHKKNQGYFVSDKVSAQPARTPAPLDQIAKAYQDLAEDRLSGAIPQHISKSLLRERYGLSGAQLNGLVTRIVSEGWAEQRPGYGVAFSPMLTTPEALLQSYRVRMALEPAALLEPSYRLDPEAARECRRTEEFMLHEGGIETMSLEELYDRGVRFHETIVGAANNPFFLDILQRINAIRRLLAYRSMTKDRERYRGQAEDHIAILDLLEKGKNREASKLLHDHLGRVLAKLQAKPSLLTG